MANTIKLSRYLTYDQEIFLVLAIISVACAIIGCFLVLKKESMLADAISHSVLLGIVLAYFVTHDLDSPLLIIGATVFGVLSVFMVQSIADTRVVHTEDAIGLVHPFFLSIAIILISKFASNSQLDTDMVLMGNSIMIPLTKTQIGRFIVPKSLVSTTIVMVIDILFVVIFYKELKVAAFDEDFAKISGMTSGFLFYAFMTLTSVTSVVSFNAVGSMLVISLMIAPAASAYLLTKDLKAMLVTACLYGVVDSAIGLWLSTIFDVSVSGMVAVVGGVTFLLTYLLNKDGAITRYFRRRHQRNTMETGIVLFHLGEKGEGQVDDLYEDIHLSHSNLDHRLNHLEKAGAITLDRSSNTFALTSQGKEDYQKLVNNNGGRHAGNKGT